jgi:tRNA nucleotidyltransferase/poly(A) polymerase
MSDYMFMLESHLSPEQNRVVSVVQAAAEKASVTVFLTGGAMRDMLGGFPIRDLDFTIEGNALKFSQSLAKQAEVTVLSKDENRRSVELMFPGGVTAEIAMAREEHYPKPGGKPQVKPATIHEDLRGRDFTINAIALSLSKASRGLLLDPTNGLDDIHRRELRATGNYALFDDPSRLLRLLRLQVRLGFEIEERTMNQYRNARQAGLERKIPNRALLRELRSMAEEPNPAALIEVLDREGLLTLFSPALTGQKINLSAHAKLQKIRQMIPFGAGFRVNNLGIFLYFLCERLSPREKSEMIKRLGLAKQEVDLWQKLEARAKKLESVVKSAKLNRASLVYDALQKADGDAILFLLMKSPHRLVHDRIKNYLQRYLVGAMEITERDVEQLAGVSSSDPGFLKARHDLIAAKLDGRLRRPAVPPEPPPAPVSVSGVGRRRAHA